MLSPTSSSNALLKPEEWNVLGRTLQYMVRNAHPLLDNGKLVLGDPVRGQPYAYVHYSPEKAIILVRNPSVRSAKVSLILNEENGFEPTELKLWADVVYPFRQSLPGVYSYGSTVEVGLDGYEQQVLEIAPAREDVARIEGVRFSQVSSQEGDVRYTIYSAKDSEAIIDLPNSSLYSQARVEGEKTIMQVTGPKRQGKIVIPFGQRRATARESQPNCQSSPIRSNRKPAGQFLKISLSCLIPSDFQQSEIALILESGETFANLEVDVVLDGKTAPASIEHSKTWYWNTITLSSGRHSVEFNLHSSSGLPGNMQVSGWLRAQQSLAAKQLHLIPQPGTKPRSTEQDPLPCSSQLERKTYPLFDQQIQ